MPSIEDFRSLLEKDANEAFKQYSLRIDAVSLDYTPNSKHDEADAAKCNAPVIAPNLWMHLALLFAPEPP